MIKGMARDIASGVVFIFGVGVAIIAAEMSAPIFGKLSVPSTSLGAGLYEAFFARSGKRLHIG